MVENGHRLKATVGGKERKINRRVKANVAKNFFDLEAVESHR
jgi:hypothetical protein